MSQIFKSANATIYVGGKKIASFEVKDVTIERNPCGEVVLMEPVDEHVFDAMKYMIGSSGAAGNPGKYSGPGGQGRITDIEYIDSSMIKDGGITSAKLKQECRHSWKEYVGFTDRYTYCEHCDIKRKD